MSPDPPLAVLVLGDMLAAACDDLHVPVTSRDVRRLAPHVLELLALAGWELDHDPCRPGDAANP